MKTTLHRNKLFVLLLFVSISAMGQYTGSYPNVATLKSATASASELNFEPEKAVDGLLTTWCSVIGDAPAWIQVDLGFYHNINGIGFILSNAAELPLSVTFQVSMSGVTWNDLGTVSVDQEGTYSFNVEDVGLRRLVRYKITEKDLRASFTELMVYGNELALPGFPLTLPPTNVTSSSFAANWTEKNRTEGYRLTVSTDIDFKDILAEYNELDVGNVQSFEVTDLVPGTTYYYRVRAYNINGWSPLSSAAEVSTLKLSQTITFEAPADRTYGDAAFELLATSSSGLPVSFMSSEDTIVTISGTTATIVGVGTAMITAVQNGDAMYDTAAPLAQDLVVHLKGLTVTNAVAESKTYDGTVDVLIDGAELLGVEGADDVTLANEDAGMFAQSEVGADIAVSSSMTLEGADRNKYILEQPGLMADITPKELLAIAEDKNREACSVNPPFTVSYSGFVDGEDESVLTEEAVASCETDENSAPGTYDITISGGSASNYSLTYVDGKLSIAEDVTSPTLTVQSINIYLDNSGSVSISPADVVVSAEDNCGVTDTTLSKQAFTTNDIGDNNVEVTAIDAAGNNTSTSATVTVFGPNGTEEFSAIDANLFPNPTGGMVELVINTPTDELKVMDMTGKTVLRRTNLGSKETIDLSSYSNGIYIFQLQSGVEMKHIKVIKK